MEYDRIYSIRKGEYFADALKRAGKDFIPTNCIINKLLPGLCATPGSYTHLDVYKRQVYNHKRHRSTFVNIRLHSISCIGR